MEISFSWKKVQCKVCKGSFTPNKTTEKVDYKDKTYIVCCFTCKSKFQENPEKYIGN